MEFRTNRKGRKITLLILTFGWFWNHIDNAFALSAMSSPTRKSLFARLQRCYKPADILQDVGQHLHADLDRDGTLSSVILVRLSKLMVSDSEKNDEHLDGKALSPNHLCNVIQTLTSIKWTSSERALDAAVEGTKAASVISRLSKFDFNASLWEPLLDEWHQQAKAVSCELKPHHLSGLYWSMDCFRLLDPNVSLPSEIQHAYDALNLPFRIRPAFLGHLDGLSVETLARQVDFQVDNVRTSSNRVVKERRQTAWEGDNHVPPFSYSGKSMKRGKWSPLVLDVRDFLCTNTSHYYDGCLLNLYPDGDSGMRYHIDPDQGTLWEYETAVVSVGATRRFAFRGTQNENNDDVHVFTLMHGDLTEMFGDCQQRYQHTVKTADAKGETSARASLVFKKTLGGGTQ